MPMWLIFPTDNNFYTCTDFDKNNNNNFYKPVNGAFP